MASETDYQESPLNRARVSRIIWLVLVLCLVAVPCHAAKRRFTVSDDIGLSVFGDPYGGEAAPITFSPDGRYFVVDTERGLLDQNRPESTLRVLRVEDVRQFLLHPEVTGEPSPLWTFSKSTYKNGPVITNIRWLPDSSGFAFLVKTKLGNDQLFLADLSTRAVRPLTSTDQQVTAFTIRSQNDFVYTALSPAIREKAIRESEATSIVATGRDLYRLMLPTDLSMMTLYQDLDELWAVADGKRVRVEDKSSGKPISLHSKAREVLALSPDGRSVVTALAVNTVPTEWEGLYPPSMPSDPRRIRAGRQDLEASEGRTYVSEYVLIDVFTGKVKPLTNAPIAENVGWSSGDVAADWSSGGQSVVLTNTFLPASAQSLDGQNKRPCITVVDLAKGNVTCLERLKGEAKTQSGFEDGFRYIEAVRFACGNRDLVTVEYHTVDDPSKQTLSYEHSTSDTWTVAPTSNECMVRKPSINIEVKESMNAPPILVATDDTTKTARNILDPNPQLKDIDLAKASVFKWKDKNGREWIGGLYEPPDYKRGYRYPLVVQTHGFHDSVFRPSGTFPTAFAAQELAAAGILVLQAPDCPTSVDPEEGPRCVAAYEGAVEKLVGEGLAEPDYIGIIGFSRTCYHVMETLTTSKIHFRAASITDGLNYGYQQYITFVDLFGNVGIHDANAVIGAPPFGSGLQQWIKLSPEFNMDKVTTPLQVVALGRLSLMYMWEPYAALRVLNRPVDLIVLADGTHVLTNPGDRVVSQGGTVDWFRFWLKGEEDPDPAKTEQYARWREQLKLRDTGQKAAMHP